MLTAKLHSHFLLVFEVPGSDDKNPLFRSSGEATVEHLSSSIFMARCILA